MIVQPGLSVKNRTADQNRGLRQRWLLKVTLGCDMDIIWPVSQRCLVDRISTSGSIHKNFKRRNIQ